MSRARSGERPRAKSAAAPAPLPELPPRLLAAALFLLSFSTVLFTLALNKINSLPLSLPLSQPIDGPPPTQLSIQVSDAGFLYWDREMIAREELASRLARYRETEADPRVLITGDDRAQFGAAVAVLDEVRLAGIEKVSFDLRTRPTGQ